MIRFQCPNCGSKLNAQDDKAGKTASCPKCKTPVKIEEVVEAQAVPPPVVTPQPQAQAQWWFHPGVIIASVIFCFPIAFVLIWMHPVWEQKTKIIWTGGIGFLFLIGMISNALEDPSTPGTSSATNNTEEENIFEKARRKGREAHAEEKRMAALKEKEEAEKKAEEERTKPTVIKIGFVKPIFVEINHRLAAAADFEDLDWTYSGLEGVIIAKEPHAYNLDGLIAIATDYEGTKLGNYKVQVAGGHLSKGDRAKFEIWISDKPHKVVIR